MFPLTRCSVACALLVAPLATQTVDHGKPDKLRVLWTTPLGSNSFGGAAVADVDGDGKLEVAFGTYFSDSRVVVLNGEDGSELWSRCFRKACLDASLRFCDVNGDGKLDLIVPVSNKHRVVAYDAATGKEIWVYHTGRECIDSPPAIVDTDGDGELEVVFGTFKKKLHVVDGKLGERKRTVPVGDSFVQTGPIVMDLNGDGVKDFIAGSFSGDARLYARDGKTGDELWHHQLGKGTMGVYHGPSIGDLNGDGDLELTLSAYDGKVYCLNATDGSRQWTVAPGDTYFMSPTVIAELDGDDTLEVVAVGERVTVIDADGKIKYSKPAGPKGCSASRGAALADLDGDGGLDIAYLLSDGLFRVLRGRDGKLLYEVEPGTIFDKPVSGNSHGVTLADLSGDGKLDAFYVIGRAASRGKGTCYGVAVCITGFAGKGRGWYMLRHDAQNSGNFATPLNRALRKHLPRR